MPKKHTLYEKILDITEDYLGPAAPRFISRLVASHLGKPATKITQSDLPELVVWIKLAATVVTEDEKEVGEYMHRLEALTDRQLKTVSNNGQHSKATS
jgi:hypothetical protein